MVYLQTTYELRFWGRVFWIMYFFQRKYKYRCIRVYVWFKDDKHVIWMWIWLRLTNISLLDRIWSLWLVRFAHSPTNFIFWLDRLIFSVFINSHPNSIYISVPLDLKVTYDTRLILIITCRPSFGLLTNDRFIDWV
jgi:hypothetical protein